MNSTIIYFIIALISTLLNYFAKPLLNKIYSTDKNNLESLLVKIRLLLLVITTVFCILAVVSKN